MSFTGVTRVGRRVAVVVGAACAVAIAIPAVAAASSTVWVSPNTVKGPFNTCATPGYNSIQEAIAISPAKTTVNVCPGTYKEQVRIEKSDTIAAQSGAVLQLPASPANTTTACDIQEPGYEDQDLIAICGAGKVTISGLTLAGRWTEVNCSKQFYGILVGGNSTLTLTGSTILYAGAEPINGCQQGVALQIGHKRNNQTGSAKLSADLIEGYQKNGITIDGPGSKAKISGITVKSAPTKEIAQNGIQVSRGATAKISGATIEGNECNVVPACGFNEHGFSPWQEEEDATGILFYLAGGGSSVKGSTINGNDIGVYNLLNAASAKTTVTGDSFTGNRYWGVSLDQGTASLSNDSISGPGEVGIQVAQYDEAHQGLETAPGQEFGAKGSGKSDTVTGMSHCALEGLSDNGPTDPFGSLTIAKSVSKFSGNTQELCNNNTTGKLTISVS